MLQVAGNFSITCCLKKLRLQMILLVLYKIDWMHILRCLEYIVVLKYDIKIEIFSFRSLLLFSKINSSSFCLGSEFSRYITVNLLSVDLYWFTSLVIIIYFSWNVSRYQCLFEKTNKLFYKSLVVNHNIHIKTT